MLGDRRIFGQCFCHRGDLNSEVGAQLVGGHLGVLDDVLQHARDDDAGSWLATKQPRSDAPRFVPCASAEIGTPHREERALGPRQALLRGRWSSPAPIDAGHGSVVEAPGPRPRYCALSER